MRSNLVTVLDLGSTKAVCLAVAPNEDGGMDIKGLGVAECRGVKRGVVTDLEETSSAIRQAMSTVKQMTGEDIGSIIVGISGGHVEGVNAQGFVPIHPRSRSITREDVLQVINHSRQLMISPDREQIQAIPREFKVDGQRGIQRPIGMSGSKLEVVTYIVTGQTTHIQNIERVVGMAGGKVEQVVLQSLASGVAVLTSEELELGAAVVDIGGGTTDVAIFTNGSVAGGVSLPIGSQLVTSDLSKLLKTTPEEAERLKLEYGSAMARLVGENESVDVMQLGQTQARPLARRVLCEIIESRMRELATMVKQHLEASGMYGVLPGGLVLTGGGSHLPGTDKLFAEVMKHLRVRVAEPRLPGAYSSLGNKAGMATALGLARYTIQCGEDEFAPAGGVGNWKDRIRTFWSLIGGAKA
jgi:cell division protein FtsA